MNKLFEEHAARLEATGAGHDRVVHTHWPPLQLATRDLDDVLLLKPDITVWSIGEDGAASTIDRVVDAKWKRLDPHATDFGVDEADVCQLPAYALRYGCTALELAFPMPDGMDARQVPPTFDLVSAGQDRTVTVKVKLLPLWTQGASSIPGHDQSLIEAEAA